MKLQLDIKTLEGDVERYPVLPRTQVAYERHFSTPDNPVRLNEDISMEGLYWLAWHASRSPVKYDTWLDGIEEVEAIAETEDDDGPLGSSQSSGTLLPSPSNPEQASPSTS